MTDPAFAITPGWLDWYRGPTEPAFPLPTGAVDTHCHVFGPAAEFPYAAERKYTPVDASKHDLFALRDRLGIARNVIVQATNGDDVAQVSITSGSPTKPPGMPRCSSV